MATSPTSHPETEVQAVGADVNADRLRIDLSDGRSIEVRLSEVPWLRWLREASDEQRSHWAIEPGGFAIYWEDLDDGVEVRHLLGLTPVA